MAISLPPNQGWADRLEHGTGSPRRHSTTRIAGWLLGLSVFLVDSFTPIQAAVAVLYVVAMLLTASGGSRRTILNAAAAFLALTLLSFALTHGTEATFPAVLRMLVAVAAIAVTAGLLIRDQASRERLVQAHEALTRSERRYRGIFAQAPFSLWEQDYSRVRDRLEALRAQGVTDIASHIRDHPDFPREVAGTILTTDVNAATLELLGGSSAAQVLGPLRPFYVEGESVLPGVLQAMFERRDGFEGVGRIRGVDGRLRKVLIGIGFPSEPDGFDRVVVSLVDVTAREEAQQALLAAQAELARASRAATVGALSASIAHELNQPLGALVMNAQTSLRWLRRDPPDLESAMKAIERTVRDGNRASEIVRQTRAFLVKGQKERERIDLRGLCAEAVALLEHELAQRSVAVRIDGGEGLAIRANRVEMQQVLVNLLANGAHAMAGVPEPDRLITVTIGREGADQVRVAVRDRGTGIGEEDLGRLFNPFFTTREDGMGMGLAISRSAVETEGGRLGAGNHPEGGAMFEIVLPLDEERPA